MRIGNTPPGGRSAVMSCQVSEIAPIDEATDIEFEDHCKFIRADSMRPVAPKRTDASASTNNRNRWLLEEVTDGPTHYCTSAPLAYDGGCVTLSVKKDSLFGSSGYKWTLLNHNVEFVRIKADGEVLKLDNPGNGRTVTVRALDTTGTAIVKVEKNGKAGTTRLEVVRVSFEKCPGAACPEATAYPTYGFDDCRPQPPMTRPPINWDIKSAAPPPNKAPYEHLLYPHISIEQDKQSHVHVKIEGNADASNFIFESASTSICEILNPTPTGKSFVLRLKGGDFPKEKTLLHVTCKGVKDNNKDHTCQNEGTSAEPRRDFAKLGVHVYMMREVKVRVVKLFDSSKPKTFTRVCEKMDFNSKDANNTRLNNKLKKLEAAVLKFEISNYPSNYNPPPKPPLGALSRSVGLFDVNGLTVKDPNTGANVPASSMIFDSNGFLVCYAGFSDGGGVLNTIQQLLKEKTPADIYVVIVKDIRYLHVLDSQATAGKNEMIIKAESYAPNSQWTIKNTNVEGALLGDNPNGTAMEETVEFVGAVKDPNYGGIKVTLKQPLANTYPAGSIIERRIGGYSSTPILVKETKDRKMVNGNFVDESPDMIMRTVMHEVGHNMGLGGDTILYDVLDVPDAPDGLRSENMMHYATAYSDNILRYCPRPRRYDADFDPNNSIPRFTEVESQWEVIPR